MEEGDPSDDKLYVILRGSVGVYVRGPNWSKMHEKEI
jgi:CRP-like cAMP-binding protein